MAEAEYQSTVDRVFGEPHTDDDNSVIHDFFDSASGLEEATDGEGFCFPSVAHETIFVSSTPSENRPEGKLDTDVPSIIIEGVKDDALIHLTWIEARMLCAALWQLTNVLEFG